jgi:hypothetical protein
MSKDEMQWNNLAANPEFNPVKDRLKKVIPEHKANYFGIREQFSEPCGSFLERSHHK